MNASEILMMAALREACECNEPERNPPTDWGNGQRIPHHCDCPLYTIELPPVNCPASRQDALRVRAELFGRAFGRITE